MKTIIYDIGSNNGDDIPYYLKKADLVVAVEANPVLCAQIRKRFNSEINLNKLIIENSVLVANQHTPKKVDFFIHIKEDVLSQFLPPQNLDLFNKVSLPAISVQDLVKKYGEPYYIKIDVEHYDEMILNAFFENDIRPPYISSESHSIKIFTLLVAKGGYQAFKLVDGESVAIKYNKHNIVSNNTKVEYSFPRHSAGPFGEDIPGGWMNADNFFKLLAFEGLGWKDIHATSLHMSNPLVTVRIDPYLNRLLVNKLKAIIPSWLKNTIKFFIIRK